MIWNFLNPKIIKILTTNPFCEKNYCSLRFSLIDQPHSVVHTNWFSDWKIEPSSGTRAKQRLWGIWGKQIRNLWLGFQKFLIKFQIYLVSNQQQKHSKTMIFSCWFLGTNLFSPSKAKNKSYWKSRVGLFVWVGTRYPPTVIWNYLRLFVQGLFNIAKIFIEN